MNKINNDFVGAHLVDGKESPRRFFTDKVVLLLSLLILSFIVIDSFITLLPVGNGAVVCLVNNSVQQAFANAYCSEKVPRTVYIPPLGIFGLSLLIILLHHTWYSTVFYLKNVNKDADKMQKAMYLSIFYLARNGLQFCAAVVPTVFVGLYEFDVKYFGITRSFDCPTELLDPILKCIYSSTVLSKVFILFYGFASLLIAIAAAFGALDILWRPDLEVCGSSKCSCCCLWKIPSDYSIINFCFPSTAVQLPLPQPHDTTSATPSTSNNQPSRPATSTSNNQPSRPATSTSNNQPSRPATSTSNDPSASNNQPASDTSLPRDTCIELKET